jgi:hypothetical protein
MGVGGSAAAGAASGAAAGAFGGPVGMMIGAGIGAGASIFGAKKQSSAAKDAAKLQVDAANHAADLQKQSNDAALAFQKEQAARDQAMAEATRHGNYDLEAARVGRLGSLADLIGAQHPQMPGYVPLDGAPAASGGPAPASAAAPGGIPKATGDLAKDLALANQITGGKGVSQSDLDYWAKAGYAKDPQYFFQKMLGMDAGPQDAPTMGPYAGGAARATTSAMRSPNVYGSLGSMATTPQRAPLTPALTAPGYAYRPYSLNAMTRS